MTARFRSRRRAVNWVSIRRSGLPRKRLTEKPRTLLAVAPRQIDRLGDADARSGHDLDCALAREEFEGRDVERQTTVLADDTQRFTEPAGAGAQQPLVVKAAPPAHRGEPGGGLDRPDQYGAGRPLPLTDEVHAPVDAVGAVDIGVTRRPEHHRIAVGPPAKTVRCSIGVVI